VLQQVSLQKALDSQKKFTRFKIFASKFAVLLEMV